MKKTAYISDIHANEEALRAVLADIKKRGIERIVCLGDIVGYGGSPKECIDLIEQHCELIMCGNHDYAAYEITGTFGFNSHAIPPIEWTRKQLFPKKLGVSAIFGWVMWIVARVLHKVIDWIDDLLWSTFDFGVPFESVWQKLHWKVRKDGLSDKKKAQEKLSRKNKYYRFLSNLPLAPVIEENKLYVHASPRDHINEYLSTATHMFLAMAKIKKEEKYQPAMFAFVGHTHEPCVYFEENEIIKSYAKEHDVDAEANKIWEEDRSIIVSEYFVEVDGNGHQFSSNKVVIPKDADITVITNVGSVGQPRDGDNRASYVVFEETETDYIIQSYRVEYDRESAGKKILKANYSSGAKRQAERLNTAR